MGARAEAQPSEAPASSARPATTETAPPSLSLGRSGRFGWGAGIEVLGLGLTEAWSGGRGATGLHLLTAAQIDLGPRWALRLPLSIDSTVRDAGEVGYVALAFSPGIVHRWRTASEQRWIPFAGAGLRLGAFGARRDFLGLPLVSTNALFIEGHHFGDSDGHGSHDPNVESHGSIGPELWAGVEFHPNRWIAWIFGATYTVAWASGTAIHVLREGVSFRLTL